MMTEAEWLACEHMHALLTVVNPTSDRRKNCLLRTTLARRLWHLMEDKRSRYAPEGFERYIDGQTSAMELKVARADACKAILDARDRTDAAFEDFNTASTAAGLGDRGVVPLMFMRPMDNPVIVAIIIRPLLAHAAHEAAEAAAAALSDESHPEDVWCSIVRASAHSTAASALPRNQEELVRKEEAAERAEQQSSALFYGT